MKYSLILTFYAFLGNRDAITGGRGGVFQSKVALEYAADKSVLFQTPGLAKCILFGSFGKGKVKFSQFMFRSPQKR